jgi:hypothetical protein
MGSRQIVLVSTAGFSVLNTGIFWREAKTKRLFSQCRVSTEVFFYFRQNTELSEKYLKFCGIPYVFTQGIPYVTYYPDSPRIKKKNFDAA